MRLLSALALALAITGAAPRHAADEARLIRYPDYHQGRVAFTYLADIWTADENGQNVQRLTVNDARDAWPRFSPDGKWVAFSSDRNGNLDVFIIPAAGGSAKQLTFHSADDNVLGWTPDGRSVLFSSNRGEDFPVKLYTVSVDGGMARPAGVDFGLWGSYSPDGKKIAYNQKSQVYWRKFYRGSSASDVVLANLDTRSFTRLTDFAGLDSWPMVGGDGFVYFVSDRDDNSVTNVWRVSDKGGNAERMTTFRDGDVRWPSISSDRKVIVFEHNFGVWKLDLATRKTTELHFDIAAETQQNASEVRDFGSQADDFGLAPNGRRFAFSIHGEVFTAPVEEGDVVQLTDSPARDQAPQYSPDGKSVAYVSDASGREEIWVTTADGSGAPRKLTDLDALKSDFAWSSDSRTIAYTSSDNTLRTASLDPGAKAGAPLATSRYGGIGGPSWSPDGKWIAFSRSDFTRTTDLFIIPAAGGEEHKVTFESYGDVAPMFSPDGRRLFFIRTDGQGGGGSDNPSQLYAITLAHEDRDPAEPDERADRPEGMGMDRGAAAGMPPAGAGPAVRETQIDWAGLKRRTRQLTRMPFSVRAPAVSPDGRTVAFVTTEPAGAPSFRAIPVIYTMAPDGKRLTRVLAGSAGGDDDAPQFGGFGGGVGDLAFSRDGRTLYFRERDGIYSVAVTPASGGAATGAAATAPAGAGARADAGGRRKLTFAAKVRIDRQAEWGEMFGDAWRTMKYRFYDPRMHGHDWDAARAKYEPMVRFAGDRQEVLNLVNEMIGELDASHTGAAPPPGGRAGGVSTGHLGVDLEPDEKGGRYRVASIYEDGPADKDWVNVSVGDYLIAINGKSVAAGDDYWQLLNNRLNRKVEVTFSKTPTAEGAWKTRIEPVSPQAYSQLRYERWVKQRRELTGKLSGGRVGYLHIQAMNQPSLRRFEKELRENRNKEALVIDQRWNGGGNIEQELLAILVQREYQIWQPRGTEESARPFAGYFGPKVVLQNWRSASNAEMFPAGFKALGLGKTVGTPTMGAVIGTGSYSLIDGSTVRTPSVGVYLADQRHTNMERYGVQPDIMVDNSPEDNLAGRDKQLEAAVQELLKQLAQAAPKVSVKP